MLRAQCEKCVDLVREEGQEGENPWLSGLFYICVNGAVNWLLDNLKINTIVVWVDF